MVSEECHQISAIPQKLEFHKKMAEIFKKVVLLLNHENIDCGMFLKCLAGHMDANASEDLILPYQKFVGHKLKPSITAPCLLDENFQDYVVEIFKIYAACNFKKIMLDDDFRTTNHSGGQIGCFCPIHANKTAKKVNIELNSKTLLKHVLSNDKLSLKIRESWMEANFEEQLKFAKKIGDAIHEVNPYTMVGLMNSGEVQHSLQGRDMPKLLKALSGENQQPISRPAGTCYTDSLHYNLLGMHFTTALSMYAGGDDVMYISEVENFPRTIYSKSACQTDLQMRLQSLAGVSELTLNIFDHYQTPTKNAIEYLDLLKDNKCIYDKIQLLRVDKELFGIAFPWKKDICAKLINRSHTIKDIIPQFNLDKLFLSFGVPIKYGEDTVNCIEGDMILCYEPNEIENSLLSKGLILDRIAAEHLCNMGYSKYIGVSSPEKVNKPCYEQYVDNYFSGEYAGQYTAIYLKSNEEAQDIPYIFELDPHAKSISVFLDNTKKQFASAVTLFENELGGRVCVFGSAINTNNWLYKSRAYQIRRIAEWSSNSNLPIIVENAVNVAPIYYENKKTGEGLLALVNIGCDMQKPVLKTSKKIKDVFSEEQLDLTLQPFEVKHFICN